MDKDLQQRAAAIGLTIDQRDTEFRLLTPVSRKIVDRADSPELLADAIARRDESGWWALDIADPDVSVTANPPGAGPRLSVEISHRGGAPISVTGGSITGDAASGRIDALAVEGDVPPAAGRWYRTRP